MNQCRINEVTKIFPSILQKACMSEQREIGVTNFFPLAASRPWNTSWSDVFKNSLGFRTYLLSLTFQLAHVKKEPVYVEHGVQPPRCGHKGSGTRLTRKIEWITSEQKSSSLDRNSKELTGTQISQHGLRLGFLIFLPPPPETMVCTLSGFMQCQGSNPGVLDKHSIWWITPSAL